MFLIQLSCYHDNYFKYFMFGKYNGFVSKATVAACMYFLVYWADFIKYIYLSKYIFNRWTYLNRLLNGLRSLRRSVLNPLMVSKIFSIIYKNCPVSSLARFFKSSRFFTNAGIIWPAVLGIRRVVLHFLYNIVTNGHGLNK
jgi:hypothetical protein